MPIKRCQSGGRPGYKWGDNGKCYIYTPGNKTSETKAKEKARTQGAAIGEYFTEVISKIRSKIKNIWGAPQKGRKIGFDYDGTLTKKSKQRLVTEFLKNNTVYIVTASNDSDMKPVRDLAKELGIPSDNVYNTNGKDKWPIILELGLDVFYDNNQEQIDKIREHTDTTAILVN